MATWELIIGLPLFIGAWCFGVYAITEAMRDFF